MINALKKPNLRSKNYQKVQLVNKHGSNYVELHVEWTLQFS
jgi:hypothetical protein